MGQIYLSDIRMHAYHGVLEQERRVGNDYVLNVVVDYPLLSAALSDDVADTLNYAMLADTIKREMLIPSNLLENVAHRICKAIIDSYPGVEKVEVDIRKIAPPMPCDCKGAGVRMVVCS